jgi:hypothetical protein
MDGMKWPIDSTSEAERVSASQFTKFSRFLDTGNIKKQQPYIIAQDESSESSVNLMILKLNPLKLNRHIDV